MRFMREDLLSLKNSKLAQSPPEAKILQKIVELDLLTCGEQTTENLALSTNSKILNGFEKEPLNKFYRSSSYFVKGESFIYLQSPV